MILNFLRKSDRFSVLQFSSENNTHSCTKRCHHFAAEVIILDKKQSQIITESSAND